MPNPIRENFLTELKARFGDLSKLSGSNSLFDIGSGAARIYVRYSKKHLRGGTFYGLREEDLRQLQGLNSHVVFLWDDQTEPLFLPYDAYESVFQSAVVATDGQYKAQISTDDIVELQIARAGRFNLEGLMGWHVFSKSLATSGEALVPEMNHWQVQSYVSAIGLKKGFDVWVPIVDRARLQSDCVNTSTLRDHLPLEYKTITDVFDVDVIWLRRGTSEMCGLFEVEHSTSIYSALLRFNDTLLTAPMSTCTYRVIAHADRRAQFVRQINRPTFRTSGLTQACTFLEYSNLFAWYRRVCLLESDSKMEGLT